MRWKVQLTRHRGKEVPSIIFDGDNELILTNGWTPAVLKGLQQEIDMEDGPPEPRFSESCDYCYGTGRQGLNDR